MDAEIRHRLPCEAYSGSYFAVKSSPRALTNFAPSPLRDVHAVRGEVSVRELMAVEFIVGKGRGSGLKPHDMGVARFHVQIGVMGLVGLRAGGEHHGPGPDHMHFPA